MTEDSKHIADGAIPTAKPCLTVDWARYERMLAESDLDDDQKRAFLEALWSIIVSFVDLGFGVHPLQLVCENSCEQQAEIAKFIADDVPSVVGSKDRSSITFNAAADVRSAVAQKEDQR